METKETLTKSDIAILAALQELADHDLAVTASGLRLVLLGEGQELAEGLSCYGYYANLATRQFHARIHLLVRHGYIRLRYEEEMRDYALLATEKAEEARAFRFKKRAHQAPIPSLMSKKEKSL